jgi:hypothetical protein
MSDLASLMTAWIDQKTGNKEFGLFYMPDYGWHVRIGSDSRWWCSAKSRARSGPMIIPR